MYLPRITSQLTVQMFIILSRAKASIITPNVLEPKLVDRLPEFTLGLFEAVVDSWSVVLFVGLVFITVGIVGVVGFGPLQ